MNIIPSEIEKYCAKKLKYPIHTEVELKSAETSFRFVAGPVEHNGNLAIYLSGKEILDILDINGIIGKGSVIEKILRERQLNMDGKIHDQIYSTVAK